ncbi:T9SS type A sorting domain-containing protein, partial [Bacteroides salyersiae]
SEAITIKTVGKNIEKISIHSLVGQTVLTAIGNGTAEQNLDISTLSAGTYLVVINTENGKETVKLIVK